MGKNERISRWAKPTASYPRKLEAGTAAREGSTTPTTHLISMLMVHNPQALVAAISKLKTTFGEKVKRLEELNQV